MRIWGIFDKFLKHLYVLVALFLAWSFVSATKRFEHAVTIELYELILVQEAAADLGKGNEIDPDAPVNL